METIERVDEWRRRYADWERKGKASGDDLDGYPFVENKRAPFTPARRALSMLSLALISSAGGYIDGTQPFDTSAAGGDTSFREIPIEVEAADILFAARGYDPRAVREDLNAQVPVARLFEFENNGIIGQLNPVWWSFNGFIPDAARLADELLPGLIERVKRYEVQAALLIPASRLCHQSVALVARALESEGIPTIMLGVEKYVLEKARPPRAGFYKGEFGSIAGRPLWPEHQRRVLDEALRWLEPIDQPTVRKLVVELESEVEKERGEK
ncbi:MAG TPA: glycine/sarcosine/betaine reductase selenoprotein B family protein [Pyrinomonadaceae bacterium]